MVMTCNTEYFRQRDDELQQMAERVLVLNYYGDQSFRISDNENNKSWDDLGKEKLADTYLQWFDKDEQNLIPDNYLQKFEDGVAYQTCTAIAPMYSTVNG